MFNRVLSKNYPSLGLIETVLLFSRLSKFYGLKVILNFGITIKSSKREQYKFRGHYGAVKVD